MAALIPSALEELNMLQSSFEYSASPTMYSNEIDKEFDNIRTEKRLNREVSFPNDVENWNLPSYEPYLNFEDLKAGAEATDSLEDRLVPEDIHWDHRQRCSSFSSMASSMDDHALSSYGLKTFNTICMDSGSTCISSDHSYVSPPMFRSLDAEETYQNLNVFLQEVPEVSLHDNLPSPLSSNDSNFDISSLHSSFSFHDIESPKQDKRPIDSLSFDEEFCTAKRPCETDIRRKSAPQKNCRKTRKEKQKDMEYRVVNLETEREALKVEVKVLEEMIQAHKLQLYAILQKR